MSKWTETAENAFLNAVTARRAANGPQSFKPEEMRVEVDRMLDVMKVETVDSVDVERALTALGYTYPGTGSGKAGMFRRSWRSFRAGWLFFGLILLPAITLGVELVTGMCGDTFFDPIPTWKHVALVACVPILGLYCWIMLRKGRQSAQRNIFLAAGFLLAISICYTCLYIPITPLAFMVLGFVWYLGIGLMGLLPLAPLIALTASIQLISRAGKLGAIQGKTKLVAIGALAGFVVIAIASSSIIAVNVGLSMATSEDADTQARGIKVLRHWCHPDELGRALTGPAWGINRGDFFGEGSRPLAGATAASLFYRVTGEPLYEEMWSRSRAWADGNGDFQFDAGQGGDAVGGTLRGLSLAESRLDGTVSPASGYAYMEWIMEFKNDSSQQREARTRIAVPPGSVASRVTLWIDGEEREAAVGSRAQVKEAYRKVVARRRDPILVTTCGPDRLLVQCFPVPPQGTMKVKIGLTIPLEVSGAEAGKAQLRLPVFIERNFTVVPEQVHSLWLKCPEPIELDKRISSKLTTRQLTGENSWQVHGELPNTPELASKAFLSTTRPAGRQQAWSGAIGKDSYIIQNLRQKPDITASAVVLAIDTSARMHDHIRALADTVEKLPDGVRFAVVASSDGGAVTLASLQSARQQTRSAAAAALRGLNCEGGRPHMPMLNQAFDLVSNEQSAHIVWIHAPVPVNLGSIESLRQRFERVNPNIALYDLQAGIGPNKIAEDLDDIRLARSLPVASEPAAELSSFLGMDDSVNWEWVRERVVTSKGDPEGIAASRHLARLWARDEVLRMISSSDPVRNEEAIALARSYAIVTPVSGMVVLESKEQYDEAGLTPMSANSVPTIPEPELWLLLIVAAFVVVFAVVRQKAHA